MPASVSCSMGIRRTGRRKAYMGKRTGRRKREKEGEYGMRQNEKLFHRLVDYATVYQDGRVVFTFRNGVEVSSEI